MIEVGTRVTMRCGTWTKVGTVTELADSNHVGKTRVLWEYYTEAGDPTKHGLGRRSWVKTSRLTAAERPK